MSAAPITVRFAVPEDLAWCVTRDHHVPPAIIARKIGLDEILVAELVAKRAGYLRLEYLWSSVPYIALIGVVEQHRREGIGRAMLDFLEAHLRGAGHHVLMSSSQVNEAEPQAWHRHMGFEECGILTGINAGGVGEVFFRKGL
ncbi:MAG TPA: GNAT family N-acetyltransferase [Aggregatilineaceae bacterium]|nr:GNAT family N-acetyltransferase [Aggregatilineaceae bacterium]